MWILSLRCIRHPASRFVAFVLPLAAALVTLPLASALAERAALLASETLLSCVEAGVGDEFTATLYVEIDDGRGMNRITTTVWIPTGIALDRVVPHSRLNEAKRIDPHTYRYSLSWSECQSDPCLAVLTLQLRVTSPVSNAPIALGQNEVRGCTVDRAFLPGNALMVNPVSGCSSSPGGLEVLADEVTHLQATGRIETVEIPARNMRSTPILYRSRAAYVGSASEWLPGPIYGTLAAGWEGSILLPLDTTGLPAGSYRATVEFLNGCAEEILGSANVELIVPETGLARNRIGIYFDEGATDCDTEASAGDLVDLFIFGEVHDFWVAATEFRIGIPGGVKLIGITYGPNVTITNGNVEDGIQMALGMCRPGPLVYLARAKLLVNAPVSEADFHVLPHPVSSFLGFADCDPSRTLHASDGGYAVINGDCQIEVDTKDESWGTIKAMYRTAE
jgi:hypothetical protein